ncbi:hypothetical protein [Methanoculleus frigidifontis]|uniref:hypothetical protein n=1 Tax=Methanoculleus frigidifontis TaxID=2584085 RepID=UPI00265AF1EA|nr:hypothetical protein [Methanoculleus sp. FWC-SCC1]
MKTFTVDLTGDIEVETDQQCDAEVLADRILDEIRAIFAGHGAVKESSIAVAAIREKPE